MSTNPLTIIDALVHAALTEFGELTALVPATRIQVFDRSVDVRGEVEDAFDLGGRVWVIPQASSFDLDWATGEVKHLRRYSIGFGVGTMQVGQIRDIERAIQRALARLSAGLKADGTSLTATPSGWAVEPALVGPSDPEREPIADPQEWRDVCDVTLTAFEPRPALLSDVD